MPVPKASVLPTFPGGTMVGAGGGAVGFSANVGLLQHDDTDGLSLQVFSKEGNAQYPCPLAPIAHICPVSQFSLDAHENPQADFAGGAVGAGVGSRSASTSQNKE